jgi:SAM-dependent methyltransferase
MFAFLERVFTRLRGGDPVVEEWERYARHHRKEHGSEAAKGAPLGDEWNRPETIGADVPAEALVAHLVSTVFAPYFGDAAAGGTLLEIGAGGGRFTQALLPCAGRIVAADTAPSMVALLRERFAAEPRVEPLLLDGRGLGALGDASVDAAFSYDVFVHLSPWVMGLYLMELARVLRPGAPVVIHHANTLSDLGWGRFVRDVERLRKGQHPDSRFTPMTPELFAGLAERAGLRVERCVTDVVRRDAITLARKAAPSGGS